ncbi:MAG: nuclear transport factor 2 family protein [Gammaproteobacteria bacterium]|nr:MAG: nuclear transport factor 2 family protein [Gammaproteobacteria bacterium]
MRVRVRLQPLLLAALLLVAGVAAAGPAADSRFVAQVLAAEDARFAAMISADSAALGTWLADDLYYVHSTGSVESRGELLASLASGRIRYHAIEVIEREVLALSRTAALVRGVAGLRVSADGRPLELRIRYLAVYGRQAGHWRLRTWQSLQLGPR